ncbi:glucosyltransferase domain-containing protein [Paenibacillus sp. FSL K6-2524]|uniref:glucosyltransferase domain-containing protein n=1 Tax=Paenibacillus sp. FSL K6-2524 TaxID=2954516 RepID=UPI0030F54CCE
MLKEAIQRDKYYWLLITITILLTYGFTLTNFSMGVDDESFNIYINEGALLGQGRWGGYITKFIFNTYDFLPFWRDIIGVLLITAGITFWGYLIQKFSNNYFNNVSIIIFSCVAISCPFIADNFIFMLTTIEMGTVLCLVPLSLNCFFEWAMNRNSFRKVFISGALLLYALSFSELAIVYFLLGIFIVCLVTVCFSERKMEYTIPNILFILLKGFSLIVGVLLLNSIIISILQKVFSISPNKYIFNHIQYDFSSIGNFIDSLMKFLKAFFQFDYISQNLGTFIAFLSGLFLLLYSTAFSLKKKKMIYLLLGIGCVLAAFSMYFINGSIHILNRMLITNSVFTGFVASLFYMYFKNKYFLKIKLRRITTLLIVLIVLYQSKNMNQLFYTDYLRYQLDLAKMNSIAEEIQKYSGGNSQKEIVFIGQPENYNLKLGNTEGYSIFQWDRNFGLQSQLRNSSRIFRFMNSHGYNIKQLIDMDEQEIITRAGGMEHYPNDGYVNNFGEYVIVKLGPMPYVTSELTLTEFYKKYRNDTSGVKYSKDWFSFEANILRVEGWGHVDGMNSSDTAIQVALFNDRRQYLLKTDTLLMEDAAADVDDGLITRFSVSLDTTTLMEGIYDVALIISDHENTRVEPIGETIQLP